MIKYLKHEEIDIIRWDICIEESFNGMVYAKSWYLNLVADQWDGLVEGDYEAVFPVVWRKKWGIRYLYQPVFTQQLGVFSKNLLSEEVVHSFLSSIPTKYRLVEINLNTFNKVKEGDFTVKNMVNHELDLINGYDKISQNYSDNLKRNLRKAESNQLNLLTQVKPDDIIRLFRENRGMELAGLTERDYFRLSRLTYQGMYKGLITTYGVYSKQNELVAGAFILRSNKKVIFLFSGLNASGRDLRAMPFLIDSFIRQNSRKHLTLDFEGSNDPGLARFYKSFGSKVVTYPQVRINKLPALIKLGLGLIRLFRRFQQFSILKP